MSLEKIYFAVAEVDGPVFGIGTSVDEAIADAVQHYGDVDSVEQLESLLVAPEEAISGELFVAEATEEFIDEVRMMGGDIEYDANSEGELILS